MLFLFDAFRQFFLDLRTQKLRTFLTTFGIMWGTVTLSLLLAFGDGMYNQMKRSFAGLGDRIVIAWPSLTSLPYEGIGKGRRINVTDEDIEFIRRESKLLESISPEYSSNFKIDTGKKTFLVDISGVEPVFGVMRNLIPQRGGRFIDEIDLKERKKVIFLGNDLAKDIFGNDDPIGREIKVFSTPFTVIGVLAPKTQDSSYSGRDKDKAFIPSTTFQAITGAKYAQIFIYKSFKAKLNNALTEEIRTILGKKLHFDPKDTEAISVWDTTEMFSFLDTFMLAFTLFLSVVGSLTLIVGGIGVSNIMNVVVEERTKEIGIKMALGAKPNYILFQFLSESLIITAVGGIIGIVLSILICTIFSKMGFEQYIGIPRISLPIAVVTTFVVGLIGVISGYFPAREASLKEPVIAMKF